jgi:hypothetical protein
LIPSQPEKIEKTELELQKEAKKAKKVEQKQSEEEFGIMNNIINRLIGNVSVDLSEVTLRCLLADLPGDHEEPRDVPTLMFRLDKMYIGKQSECPPGYTNDLINKSQCSDK